MMQAPPQVARGESASSGSGSSSSLFRWVSSLKDEYVYSEDDLIGCGAFSSVFKAKKKPILSSSSSSSPSLPTETGFLLTPCSEQFALKIIIKKKLEEKLQLREVEREVSVLQHLRHTGCTRFTEALQTREELCIVMRFIEGSVDIARYIRSELDGGPMPELHVALVAYQLLTTVEYLHSTFRLLHRDVKLENILLSPLVPHHALQPPATAPAVDASSSTVCASSGDGGHRPASSASADGLLDSRMKEQGETDKEMGEAGGSVLSECGNENKQPRTGSVPSNSRGAAQVDAPAPNIPEIAIDDTIAARAKVTLLDFGLSRWMARPSAWPGVPGSAVQAPPSLGAPTTSPVTPSSLACFPPLLPSEPQHSTCASVSSDAAASHVLHLTPCGTDRYLPREVLRWILEHESSRKPTTIADAKKIDSFAIGVVVYIMLSAHFPFNGKTKAALAAQQTTNPPRCNASHWHPISDAAKSFVQGMLKCDVHERLGVEQALAHEWIRCLAEPLALKLGLRPGPVSTSNSNSPLPFSAGKMCTGDPSSSWLRRHSGQSPSVLCSSDQIPTPPAATGEPLTMTSSSSSSSISSCERCSPCRAARPVTSTAGGPDGPALAHAPSSDDDVPGRPMKDAAFEKTNDEKRREKKKKDDERATTPPPVSTAATSEKSRAAAKSNDWAKR
jgi:serine/threonine protein kinase